MSIATAIQNARQKIETAYTAISNKGGTLPATQDLSNMTDAINSIQTGGGGYSELPSYQVSNGVASKRSGTLTGNEFSDITSISDYGMYYAFYNCSGLTGTLDLSALTSISDYGMYYAFYNCSGLTSVDLSALTSIGSSGMSYTFSKCSSLTEVNLSSLEQISSYSAVSNAFSSCTSLINVDLSSLVTISGSSGGGFFYECSSLASNPFIALKTVSGSIASGLRLCTSLITVSFPELETLSGEQCFMYILAQCSNLKTVSFPKLTTLTGSNALRYGFQSNTKLEDVYFNALTTNSFGSNTNQFSSLMSSTGSSITHTLHFPSNLSSKISSMSGYPLFGGTSGYVTLAFDLPATS